MNSERHPPERTLNDDDSTVPRKVARQWQPLTLLNPRSLSVSSREVTSLIESWRAFIWYRERTEPNACKDFLERFYRRWAIEIWRNYDVDAFYIHENTKLTLVEKGFSVDLIDHIPNNKAPQDVIKVLQDHRDAAEFVTESIRENRELNKSFLKELHQLLMRNQKVYFEYDQFGNQSEKPLNHGQFKLEYNNPMGSDGEIREYCPPMHVEDELDRLIEWYNSPWISRKDGVSLLDEAAWHTIALLKFIPSRTETIRLL